MSYKNFGCVKTIVLPIDMSKQGGFTYSQYKEKYGLDLKDIIVLKNNGIDLKNETALHLIYCENAGGSALGYEYLPKMNTIVEAKRDNYESGVTDGTLILFCGFNVDEPAKHGIMFKISKNVEYKIENVEVLPADL